MSKIIDYPKNDLVEGDWLILWTQIYYRFSGRPRKTVDLKCIRCGYITQYEASTIHNCTRIPQACKKCENSPENRLLKLKNKGVEQLPNNGKIVWKDAYARDKSLYVPVVCECGAVRNYAIRHLSQSQNCGRCQKCAGRIHRKIGKESNNWLGGRINGKYVHVRIQADNPYFSMVPPGRRYDEYGYILEHRLVMANHLKRILEKWEHVHHINGDKKNNDISNLQLVSPDKHSSITAMEREIYALRREVENLKNQLT